MDLGVLVEVSPRMTERKEFREAWLKIDLKDPTAPVAMESDRENFGWGDAPVKVA